MKTSDKRSTSSGPSAGIDHDEKPAATGHARDTPLSANDLGHGIDRPGADLGGSSGDTNAGTGLGLGQDALDTPGDARLPGRRLDNDLTKPLWGGPAALATAPSDAKAAAAQTPAAPEAKKPR